MEWIETCKRLPEKSGSYIVQKVTVVSDGSYIPNAPEIAYYNSEDRRFLGSVDLNWTVYTHWGELPEGIDPNKCGIIVWGLNLVAQKELEAWGGGLTKAIKNEMERRAKEREEMEKPGH